MRCHAFDEGVDAAFELPDAGEPGIAGRQQVVGTTFDGDEFPRTFGKRRIARRRRVDASSARLEFRETSL